MSATLLCRGACGDNPSLEQGIAALTKAGFKVDYLELREEETLEPVEISNAPARLAGGGMAGQYAAD